MKKKCISKCSWSLGTYECEGKRECGKIKQELNEIGRNNKKLYQKQQKPKKKLNRKPNEIESKYFQERIYFKLED